MPATAMFGAGDVRVEDVPDATIEEPTDAWLVSAVVPATVASPKLDAVPDIGCHWVVLVDPSPRLRLSRRRASESTAPKVTFSARGFEYFLAEQDRRTISAGELTAQP